MQTRQLPFWSVVRRGRITQMRNFAALAFRYLPDGFADTGLDLLTVELELDHLRSAALASTVRLVRYE